jgi:hypothetical protein
MTKAHESASSSISLLVRLVFPAYRRWPTVGLNVLLLLCFPLGTALAIYGFWKVDKQIGQDSSPLRG